MEYLAHTTAAKSAESQLCFLPGTLIQNEKEIKLIQTDAPLERSNSQLSVGSSQSFNDGGMVRNISPVGGEYDADDDVEDDADVDCDCGNNSACSVDCADVSDMDSDNDTDDEHSNTTADTNSVDGGNNGECSTKQDDNNNETNTNSTSADDNEEPIIKVSALDAGAASYVDGLTSDGLPMTFVKRNVVLKLRNMDATTPPFVVDIKFTDNVSSKTYLNFYRNLENNLWFREPRFNCSRSRYYFHCKLCSKRLCSLVSMRAHLNMHLSFYPYECTSCTKRYARQSSLYKHIKAMHNNNEKETTHP